MRLRDKYSTRYIRTLLCAGIMIFGLCGHKGMVIRRGNIVGIGAGGDDRNAGRTAYMADVSKVSAAGFGAGEADPGNDMAMSAGSEADFNYEGPIDMFTGNPVTEDSALNQTQTVNISDGSVYDRTTGMYIYSMDNGSVSVSVADSMMVTGDVMLAKSENANAMLYKDGELVSDFPQVINAPGSYAIIGGDNGDTGQIMGFRILNEVTGAVNQYSLPRGFSVRSVTVNGEDVTHDYGVVDMEAEGSYDISYICSDNGIAYYLHVTVDHTPPQVTFEGLDANNRAKGPVTLVGLEEGDVVSVISGDEVKKLNANSQIVESGDYQVIVYDAAGNYIEKEIKIMVYLNLQAWMLVGLILICIVGLAIVLTITRQRLRVR